MWPNPQENAYLVIFAEEILNGKLHFLCSVPNNTLAEQVAVFLKNSIFEFGKPHFDMGVLP